MQLVVEIDSEIRNIKNYKYFNIRKLQNSDIKQFHSEIDSEIDIKNRPFFSEYNVEILPYLLGMKLNRFTLISDFHNK